MRTITNRFRPAPFFSWLIDALLLAVVSVLAHLCLVPAGLALLNADFAVYPITAGMLSRGVLYPFQMYYDYGGATLTALRVPWIWLYEAISGGGGAGGDVFLAANTAFTHLVVPVLLAWSFYFLARSAASRAGAVVAGLVAAIGFNSWTWNGGIEFYNAYLILGCFILGIRLRYPNPFAGMKVPALFGASVLCGLAFYSCRASVVYIVAFFVPVEWAWEEVKKIARPPHGRVEKIALWTTLGLLALFVWLEIFGPDLGTVFGRRIKLHAQPNFRFAALILAAVWLSRNARFIGRFQIKRGLAVVAGFVTGMLPEVVWSALLHKLPSLTGGRTYGFDESMRALGRIPGSLMEILTSHGSVLRNFSMALFVAAVIALLRAARRDRKLVPLVFAGALAVFAYIRVLTYDFAPARYLFPVFPVLLAAVAVLFDQLSLQGKRRYGAGALVVLIFSCVHMIHQYVSRVEKAQENIASGRAEAIMEIVSRFRDAGVKAVITNNYWEGNQYTVAANFNPVFYPARTTFIHPVMVAMARAEKRAGIMLSNEPAGEVKRHIELDDRAWKLDYIGAVRGITLYVGEAR